MVRTDPTFKRQIAQAARRVGLSVSSFIRLSCGHEIKAQQADQRPSAPAPQPEAPPATEPVAAAS
jgi:hypothetical protein